VPRLRKEGRYCKLKTSYPATKTPRKRGHGERREGNEMVRGDSTKTPLTYHLEQAEDLLYLAEKRGIWRVMGRLHSNSKNQRGGVKKGPNGGGGTDRVFWGGTFRDLGALKENAFTEIYSRLFSGECAQT